ncbi:hypothetical protein [Nostocoides vanveenii]|uniref:Uncharacterized protein n=1 Tax=Nostocoides vanveenii TaxID=330835 RepID=A0ABN2L3Z5_9MICO
MSQPDHDPDAAPRPQRDLPRAAQDFAAVLADLRPEHWPPSPADLRDIAAICALVIAELDTWETKTEGQDVVDVHWGPITTAEARRILARTVTVADDGVAVTLVPEAERGVYVELRGRVEDGHHVREPELVLAWTVDDEEHLHHVALKSKGPQWYMLAQLRDDLLEDRLGPR